MLALVALGRGRGGGAGSPVAALRASLVGSGPALAAVVAVVAMVGSLWFSEAAPTSRRAGSAGTSASRCTRWPCCSRWRRGADDRSDPPATALVLAGLGLAVSTWHNLIETVPSLDTGGCDPTNPCTLRWVEGLGFWTIPRMAFVAFCLVATALLARPAPLGGTMSNRPNRLPDRVGARRPVGSAASC